MLRIVILLGTLIAVLPGVVSSSERAAIGDEGPQFSIFPQIEKAGGPSDPFEVLLTFHARNASPSQVATARLELGEGLELVSGNAVHTAHVSNSWDGPKDDHWRVVLRATRLGSAELRASLSADVDPERRDESVSLLAIEVNSAGVSGASRPLRKETTRSGQRFRYDVFLVPIDGPEEVMAGDIIEPGKAIGEELGLCVGCGKEERRVPFVVFLNPIGEMHSYRTLSSDSDFKGASTEIVKAAEQALKKWKFSPSRTRRKPVAGWTIVRVRVHG